MKNAPAFEAVALDNDPVTLMTGKKMVKER
jgi:hypothetical protein